MVNGHVLSDGRVLCFDPLVDGKLDKPKNTHTKSSGASRPVTDDVAVIRYLYQEQGFAMEDIAELMEMDPVETHRLFIRQRIKASDDGLLKLCAKLDVPVAVMVMYARAWLEGGSDRRNLPFCARPLTPLGNFSEERVWTSLGWLAGMFESVRDMLVFRVADNRLHKVGLHMGDMAFISGRKEDRAFRQGAIYLLKGYDEALQLRLASIVKGQDGPEKRFVVPESPELDFGPEAAGGNLGRVVGCLSRT